MLTLLRAVLIPPYDWDSSRVSPELSRSPPIGTSVILGRRSSERLEAKLFGWRERKISGILPEAVNLARKSILLTLIGPVTERRRIARMLSAYLILSRSEYNGVRNYWPVIALKYPKTSAAQRVISR